MVITLADTKIPNPCDTENNHHPPHQSRGHQPNSPLYLSLSWAVNFFAQNGIINFSKGSRVGRNPLDALEHSGKALQETTPPGGSHDSLPIAPLEVTKTAIGSIDQAKIIRSIHTGSPPFIGP
jgi:hypothetical protein